MPVRFDAYTATTQAAKPQDLMSLVAEVVPISHGWTVQMGKGLHHFGERVDFKGHDGAVFAQINWGGSQGDRTMIEVKGEHTPGVTEALRSRFPHRCTRVDSCADFDAPGAFQRLYRVCRKVKQAHRIMGGKAGDWEDFPEKGRTLYLGSQSSPTRLRLYEKGKQPGYDHLNRPDWARLEIQVRPSKDAKEVYSQLDAAQVWGASRWSRDLASALLEEHVDPHPAGTVYKLSQRDQSLRWMCAQYGPHLTSLANELGGWDVLGLTLREMISEVSSGR